MDELALIDLPAHIDFIRKFTGQDQVMHPLFLLNMMHMSCRLCRQHKGTCGEVDWVRAGLHTHMPAYGPALIMAATHYSVLQTPKSPKPGGADRPLSGVHAAADADVIAPRVQPEELAAHAAGCGDQAGPHTGKKPGKPCQDRRPFGGRVWV